MKWNFISSSVCFKPFKKMHICQNVPKTKTKRIMKSTPFLKHGTRTYQENRKTKRIKMSDLRSSVIGRLCFFQEISGKGVPDTLQSKMTLVPSTSRELWSTSRNVGLMESYIGMALASRKGAARGTMASSGTGLTSLTGGTAAEKSMTD